MLRFTQVLVLLAISATFVAACGAPVASVPTALPTPTRLEAMQRDINPMLIQGLPVGLLPSERKLAPPPGLYQNLPFAVEVEAQWQQFRDTREDKDSGGVMLFLYGEDAYRQQAYQSAVDSIGSGTASFSGLGEASAIVEPEPGFDGTEIVFTRCRAVVHVRMFGSYAKSAKSYAERLDTELRRLACP